MLLSSPINHCGGRAVRREHAVMVHSSWPGWLNSPGSPGEPALGCLEAVCDGATFCYLLPLLVGGYDPMRAVVRSTFVGRVSFLVGT